VLLDEACADPLYRKAVRTSMGAALEVPFADGVALPETIDALKAEGWRWWG
jgi:tRNA G18 (ribose-2'-O)-methylase SpoU